MVEVNWTYRSIEDVYEIRKYYQSLSVKYAEQLTDKIFGKESFLKKHPRVGRIVPELDREEIRELIYKNYRIVYSIISPEPIDILTVHNGLSPLTEKSVFE